MSESPREPAVASPARQMEFKARLNRDIAFTIIEEQIKSGTNPAHLTGRGLAKQYGFGSPQTWVTHLKDWRLQNGIAVPDDVREAEAVEGGGETAEEVASQAKFESGPSSSEGAAGSYGMVSRAELLQHQEMWNRLLTERDATHAERLKVARMEGERLGRDEGKREAQLAAETQQLVLQERIRRERLEGEMQGAQKAAEETAGRMRRERRLVLSLAFGVGLPVGIILGAVAIGVWREGGQDKPGATATGGPAMAVPAPLAPVPVSGEQPPVAPPHAPASSGPPVAVPPSVGETPSPAVAPSATAGAPTVPPTATGTDTVHGSP